MLPDFCARNESFLLRPNQFQSKCSYHFSNWSAKGVLPEAHCRAPTDASVVAVSEHQKSYPIQLPSVFFSSLVLDTCFLQRYEWFHSLVSEKRGIDRVWILWVLFFNRGTMWLTLHFQVVVWKMMIYVWTYVCVFSYLIIFIFYFINLCAGSRSLRVVCALSKAQLQDGYVSYPWERKMREMQPVANSSCFLSMLLLPKASDRFAYRYNDLEDTLARANAWLHSSVASGVPIVFMSIQTEALLTKVINKQIPFTSIKIIWKESLVIKDR